MKKKYLLSLLAVGLLQSVETQAASYGNFISCNAINAAPQVIFKLSYGDLKHDLSKNTEEISAFDKNNDERHTHMKGKGVAVVEPLFKVELKEFDTQYVDDKTSCVYPRIVEIEFGYQKPVIYVNKDLKPNSCDYAFVLRHEQVHQRLNKIALEYFAPIFYSAIRRAVADVRALKVSQNDKQADAAKTLQSYYEASLKPVSEQFAKIRHNQQKDFDVWSMENSEMDSCADFNQKTDLMNNALN